MKPYPLVDSGSPVARNIKADGTPAEQIVKAVLAGGRKRSEAYRQGMRDALHLCISGERALCPYRDGSPKLDAYIAGMQHGNAVWLAGE